MGSYNSNHRERPKRAAVNPRGCPDLGILGSSPGRFLKPTKPNSRTMKKVVFRLLEINARLLVKGTIHEAPTLESRDACCRICAVLLR